MSRPSKRLPKRFPVGSTYVVEGRTAADGLFHVSARYVVMPNGRKLALPAKPIARLGRAPSIVPRRTRARAEVAPAAP